jgi:DNA-binding response OmpR family regulator
LSIVKNANEGNHYNNSNNNSNNDNHDHIDTSNLHSILIVDDEIDILFVIRRHLQEYGFKTCCFTKASHALEHFKLSSSKNTHKLVISDLQMPDINGFEFIREVKKIDYKLKAFLMSSNFEMCNDLGLLLLPSSSPNDSSLSTKLMIDELIPKPFSIEKLIVLINKHIS